MNKAAQHIGAVAFIHRFGSSLNQHVHFHVCVVDGVFEEVAGATDAQTSLPGITFHSASTIDAAAVVQVQADLRRRILRAFVGRGLLGSCDAKEMLAYQHSGFSVDAGVCIEAPDRAALERLLRYCARSPFAMDRLRKEGAALVYRLRLRQIHVAHTGDAEQIAQRTPAGAGFELDLHTSSAIAFCAHAANGSTRIDNARATDLRRINVHSAHVECAQVATFLVANSTDTADSPNR